MNIFRRLALPRLLLLCVAVLAVGVSASALASALGGGPVPPPKALGQAVHDALAGGSVEGVSASVTLTDRLLEGASLAGGESGSEIASSPLLTGGSGRLWVSRDGRVRIELQAEKGDTEILYDGHTATIYDASTNTLYRYVPGWEGSSGGTSRAALEAGRGDRTPAPDTTPGGHNIPTAAEVEEQVAKAREHADISGATPSDVGGRPAYTVRVAPREGGSLIAAAELSFDAAHAIPLRAAVYSTSGSSPVVELATGDVSYGPVAASVFEFTPPAGAKVQDLEASHAAAHPNGSSGARPQVTLSGHGITSIAVVRSQASAGRQHALGQLEGLPRIDLGGGTRATELRTALGTVLGFERGGVGYLVAGAVAPASVEALAKGL